MNENKPTSEPPTPEAPSPEAKSYWRSLDRLLDSPAVQMSSTGEFPPGAAEPPDGLSRRTMLTLMGASFSLAGLAACRRPVEHIVPYVDPPEELVPGTPEHYATVFPLGTSATGLVVESHEGRPTKIEGNELHPLSHGAADVWAQAAILGLYDPDRSRKVRRRSAPGAGSEAGIDDSTWEHFLDFAEKSLAYALEGEKSDGLAVLAEASSSPSRARLKRDVLDRFPSARWAVQEAVGDQRIFAGLELATGRPLRPLYDLAAARVVVALDADLLGTESDAVHNARGFAQSRRLESPDDDMGRLVAVESRLSQTGAAADHRLRLASRQIPDFVNALARELVSRGLDLELPTGPASELPRNIARRLPLLAEDLLAAGSNALLAAGRGQPAEVHALVYALQRALGATGTTVTYRELTDVDWERPGELRGLVEAMRAGEIHTLIVLGGNPVLTAPADLAFAEALENVETSIHLSSHVDETSRLTTWHLPRAHFLEAWGDARAADGTPSVIQPLIQPLHGGKSELEVLQIVQRGKEASALGMVRDTWLEDALLGNTDFEGQWNRILHDGLFADGRLEPVAPALADAAMEKILAGLDQLRPADSGMGDGMELVLTLSSAVHDGRFANNGWLQELPDSLTKIAWDNAALMSPATAEGLGVATGDVVRLSPRGTSEDGSVEAPVFVMPGQADGSIALDLGYGRRHAGRVGDGVGTDAYPLRRDGDPAFTRVEVTPTGQTHELVQTQEHGTMEGRDLVREADLATYREHPGFAGAQVAEHEAPALWPPHDYNEGYQWGMAIDLNACTGCNACVVACQAENNIPIVGKEQIGRGREMHWLRVDRYFSGDPEDPEIAFQPVPCMHCENAPCEQVCPVAATVHDDEGLNAMVYNRCIGTRYCSNNCPYKVRRFNFFNYTKDYPDLIQMAQNPDVTVRSRGVMEKCTYCVQRINEAKINAKRDGRPIGDGDLQTACQQTCPTNAIVFGNLNESYTGETSEAKRQKRSERNYVLLEELHHRPRTSFLARVRNPHPDWDDAGDQRS